MNRAGSPTDHEAQVLHDKLEADRDKDKRIAELESANAALREENERLVDLEDVWRVETAHTDKLLERIDLLSATLEATITRAEQAEKALAKVRSAFIWIESECTEEIERGGDARHLLYSFRDKCRAILDGKVK